MNRKAAAVLLAATIACPLAVYAQSVTIIGEGSGAARNTTGASASKNTIREESPGATTVITPGVPSTAGRSDGTAIGQNTGTFGTTGTTGTIGPTGATGSAGSAGTAGGSSGTAAPAGAPGGGAGGR